MTEKKQLIRQVQRIFNVLDILDEIGDSDNDSYGTLRKCRKRRKLKDCDEVVDVHVSTELIEKSMEQPIIKCRNIWNPSKGLKDSDNPLENLSDEQFIRNYRFSKECVEDILQMISYGLSKYTNRGKPCSPMLELLITLQFLATGMINVN